MKQKSIMNLNTAYKNLLDLFEIVFLLVSIKNQPMSEPNPNQTQTCKLEIVHDCGK